MWVMLLEGKLHVWETSWEFVWAPVSPVSAMLSVGSQGK